MKDTPAPKILNFVLSILVIFSMLTVTSRLLTEKVQAAETVYLTPGTNINSKIREYGPGTTYIFKPGIYRMQKIADVDTNDQFIGQNGAVLNGSRILSGFSQTTVNNKKMWVLSGQTQAPAVYPSSDPWNGNQICEKSHPRCRYSNELFTNSQRRKHVGSVNDVNPGTWFFDFDADKIYMGDDPNGKTVELSTTDYAFDTNRSGVRIKNLKVEKYATRAQDAVISLRGTDSIIEYNYVVNNHSVGVFAGFTNKDSNKNIVYPYPYVNAIIRNNILKYNGFSGYGGAGKTILFENNEIANNNEARFYFYWDGGGGKFAYTDGVTIKNNYSHHNYGNGFWTDISNINTVYENNISVNNEKHCIQHEISYKATIKFNFVGYCKQHQIYISNSKNVDAYGNTVVMENNANGIIVENKQRKEAPLIGTHVVENVNVTDNLIYNKTNQGRMAGLTGPTSSTNPQGSSPYDFGYASTRTFFNNNKYFNSSSSASRWTWGGWWTDMSFDCFRKQNKNCSTSNPIKMEASGSVQTSGYTIPSIWSFNVTRGPQ